MTWRWVWARSRLTAIVASGMVWLVLLSLAPAFVATYVLLGGVAVAGWRTRGLLGWRFGARRIEAAQAESVWRALVPVEWLRGRNQPRLWTSARLGRCVVAPDQHQLVLGAMLLREVTQRRLADPEVRRVAVRAFAAAEVNRSRLVAAVEVWCAPWSLLATVARTVSLPVARIPLVEFAWRARWLFVALAAGDLYGRAHWPGLVMLALVAVATVTTPRWDRAWNKHQAAMADGLEHDHISTEPGPSVARSATIPSGQRRGVRPVPHRGGAR